MQHKTNHHTAPLPPKGRAQRRKALLASSLCLFAFLLWTILVLCVDVRPVGPNGSSVGFSTLNVAFRRLCGLHLSLYVLTDWLGLVPIAVALGFAVLGLCQWIARRRLRAVDRDILLLGGFYAVVASAYLLFEELVINFRPVLIEGRLEASYPSSTTLLVLTVMPTAILVLSPRLRSQALRRTVCILIALFSLFMLVGRAVSGVHWASDIVGGVLLSLALDFGYAALDSPPARVL